LAGPEGHYVLKILARQKAGQMTLEEAKGAVTEALQQQAFLRNIDAWKKSVRDEAKIVVHNERLQDLKLQL
jgi:hypothetical protein